MEELKKIDTVQVEDFVKILQELFELKGPEAEMDLDFDWFSGVPDGAVPYLNVFRLKYFEYKRHIELLDKFFKKNNVRRVGDLGCGVATHLVRLAELGYECVGIDQSDESLAIAAGNAQKSNVNLELVKGDIRTINLENKLDAVISMYVPLSGIGSDEALKNAHRFLRNKGYFAKVHGTPDPSGVPERDSIFDVDVEETENFRVARLEHWWINGEIISWNAYFFVRNTIKGRTYSNDVHLFADHNDIHLNRDYSINQLKNKWNELGYQVAELNPIPGSEAAPPWTEENLLILQRI